MGVWQRSPAGLGDRAAPIPSSTPANRAALPDLRPEDVIGSPYCVRDYVVDERFGGADGAGARPAKQLADRGLGLILDYVPNHVAPDHPWLVEHPDCFVARHRGRSSREHPEAFVRTAGGVFANGRDPYFAAVARRRPAERVLAGAARRGRRDADRDRRASATACAATWRC